MEALGGTSARKALPPRSYEQTLNNQASRVLFPLDEAEPGKKAVFWRRLASLNGGQIASDIYFAVETLVICVLGVLAGATFVDGAVASGNLIGAQAIPLFMVPAALAVLFKLKGFYAFEHLAAFSKTIVPALLVVCLVYCLAILGAYSSGYSGVWLSAWMLFALAGFAMLRLSAGWICAGVMRTGAIHQSVAVFGDPAATQSACQSLAQSNDLVKLAGVFGPLNDGVEATGQCFDGDLDALIEGALANTVDTIIIATDRVSSDELQRLLAKFERLPCAVQVYLTCKSKMTHTRLGRGITVFEVQAKPVNGWGRVCKRCLDITLASIGLLCLAPFLLIVAAAIKLDSPGPVFFAQGRHGMNRKTFRIFKLRTMSVMEDGDNAVQAARQDPRVTRIGAFLRKTSVDELPQLLNVLKGEMSLVGPRPHPLSLDNFYADRLDGYSSRHKVKPGITGWAQIHGHRGPTDQPGLMQGRIQHDLDYINNWSFWLDLKILAATPFLGIIHKNAV